MAPWPGPAPSSKLLEDALLWGPKGRGPLFFFFGVRVDQLGRVLAPSVRLGAKAHALAADPWHLLKVGREAAPSVDFDARGHWTIETDFGQTDFGQN